MEKRVAEELGEIGTGFEKGSGEDQDGRRELGTNVWLWEEKGPMGWEAFRR